MRLRIDPRIATPFQFFSERFSMKLTIRNAHEEWREPVEKETHRQAAKLEKLLKRYAPDLVQLHARHREASAKGKLHVSLLISRFPRERCTPQEKDPTCSPA